MAVVLRLARAGATKRPFYHVVAADSRMPRDGRFIERVGSYDPMLMRDNPNRVRLNTERIQHWLGVGARPSDRVARFLGETSLAPMPERRETPKKSQPKKKAQERMKEAAEKAAAAAAQAPAEQEAQAEGGA